MSTDPLDLAHLVLETLKDVDTYTAATAVAIAHKVLEHRQTQTIYESQQP